MKIKIVLYADQDREPIVLPTTTAPSSVQELRQYIGKTTGNRVKPKLVSFWNYAAKTYSTLENVEQLKQKDAVLSRRELQALEERTIGTGEGEDSKRHFPLPVNTAVYRAQLWVETALLVLEPLEPEQDKAELAELSNHVRKWTGNKYITYDLVQASRIYYPALARRFDRTRVEKLHDAKDTVRLMYYTNNVWSTAQVMQFGFMLAERPPVTGEEEKSEKEAKNSKYSRQKSPSPQRHQSSKKNPFIFSSSMIDPVDEQPPLQDRQKVLLCEVAPGRPWQTDQLLTSSRPDPLPPAEYDCFYYEEDTNQRDRRPKAMQHTKQLPPLTQVSVGHDHQALPRYLLTIVPRKRDEPSKCYVDDAVPTNDRFELDQAAGGVNSRLFRRPSIQSSQSTSAQLSRQVSEVQYRGSTQRARSGTSRPPSQSQTQKKGRQHVDLQHSPGSLSLSIPSPESSIAVQQMENSFEQPNLSFNQANVHQNTNLSSARSSPRGNDPLRPSQVRASFGPITPIESLSNSPKSNALFVNNAAPDTLNRRENGNQVGAGNEIPKLYSSTLSRPDSPRVTSATSPRSGGITFQEQPPSRNTPSSLYRNTLANSNGHSAAAAERRSAFPSSPPTRQISSNVNSARSNGGGDASPWSSPRGNTNTNPTGPRSSLPLRPSIVAPNASIGARANNGNGRTSPLPQRKPGILNQEASLALKCGVHTAQLMTLYCNSCRELTCPYCASIGQHRGHDVVEAEVQAEKLGADMEALCHDLIQWLDHYRRVERQLQTEASRQERKKQQREHELRGHITELRRALDARERALLRQLEEVSDQVKPPVVEAAHVRAKYAKAIAPLEQALRSYQGYNPSQPNAPIQPRSSAATLHFLKIGPSLMREALHSFKMRDQQEELRLREAVKTVQQANSRVAAMLSTLQNTADIRAQIDQLGSGAAPLTITSARSKSRGPSPPLSPGGASTIDDISFTLSRPNSPRRRSPSRSGAQAPSLVERCLLDLQRGHLWVIQDASRLFGPGQHRAVCSTPFTLLGLPWELRIAVLPGDPNQGYFETPRNSGRTSPAAGVDRFSPQFYDTARGGMAVDSSWMDAQGGGNSSNTPLGEEDQWLGIFLLPQGHSRRMDFRLIAFSELTWVEWGVTGWTSDYIGKGWGLYPFLRRKDLMRTDKLARENTVKICIAPISDLY